MIITSQSNQQIKDLRKLKSEKEFLFLDNPKLIDEAVSAKCEIYKIIFEEGKDEKFSHLKKYNFIIASKDVFKSISSATTSQGVVAMVKFGQKTFKPPSGNFLVLDEVQDPGNVGTIFRTALAFNYFDIIADEGTASKYNSKVVQSSQGSIFKLNILEKNIEYLRKLKKDGYKIIVTCLDTNSKKISEICKVFDKICIVFGNEGQGVDQEILALSDEKLMIEIANIDSLNVAVSAGIILYSFKD